MRTEPWWVCSKCGKCIVRAGKKHSNAHQKMLNHRETCESPSGKLAGYYIKQIPQNKEKA